MVAIDVGRAQLHERLVADERVTSIEETNVRDVEGDDVGGPADVVTADLSFIGLPLVMERLVALTVTGGDLIVLVKPQFEAGRAEVSQGRGVVRDPEVWRAALAGVIAAGEACGAGARDVMASPIRGAAGNVEFLLWLRPGEPGAGLDLEALVAGVGDLA